MAKVLDICVQITGRYCYRSSEVIENTQYVVVPFALISAVGGAAAFRRLSAEGGHRKGGQVGQTFDPDDADDEYQKTTAIEISGMEPLYRKMMNMKNVQNFFPDMMG